MTWNQVPMVVWEALYQLNHLPSYHLLCCPVSICFNCTGIMPILRLSGMGVSGWMHCCRVCTCKWGRRLGLHSFLPSWGGDWTWVLSAAASTSTHCSILTAWKVLLLLLLSHQTTVFTVQFFCCLEQRVQLCPVSLFLILLPLTSQSSHVLSSKRCN